MCLPMILWLGKWLYFSGGDGCNQLFLVGAASQSRIFAQLCGILWGFLANFGDLSVKSQYAGRANNLCSCSGLNVLEIEFNV